MIVELTTLAENDIADAAVAYEHERPQLGFRFNAELDRTLDRIAANPRQFPFVQTGVRRALVAVFPFSVFFLVLRNHARVFAVLHQHRHPDSWKTRPRQ
jgi:plasmid stabilization system protein ParE